MFGGFQYFNKCKEAHGSAGSMNLFSKLFYKLLHGTELLGSYFS